MLLPPKTDRSRRRIELGQECVDLLRQVQVRQLEQRLAAGVRWRDTGFAFTTRTGKPIDQPG